VALRLLIRSTNQSLIANRYGSLGADDKRWMNFQKTLSASLLNNTNRTV